MDSSGDPTIELAISGKGRISAFLERRQAAALGAFTLLYAAGYLCEAASRPMWVDELWTFYLAKTPNTGAILRAIEDGIELNPPLSFLLAHAAQALFGASEAATRLPAIVGFWVMSVALFLFVRRRAGATCGYVAMLLPFFTLAEPHAAEARPYALVLGAAALALLFWQKAEEKEARRYALPAFAISIAALVSLHYYALYVVAAIAVAEAMRVEKNRGQDVWFWVSLAAGCSPLLYLAPVMKRVHAGAAHFLLTPSLAALSSVYAGLIGPASVVVFGVIALAIWPAPERSEARIARADGSNLRPHEWFVGVLLLLMPFAAFVLSLSVTNAFMARYVLPVVIGPALLVPVFVHKIGAACPRLPATAVCVLFGCFSLLQLHKIVDRAVLPSPAISVQRSVWTQTRTDLPLVIDDDNQFLRIAHYGTAAMQAQTYFLIDHQLEIKHVGFDTPGRTMEVGRRLHPLHVVDYTSFVNRRRQFLFLRNSSLMLGWIGRQLLEEGAEMRLIQFEKQHGYQGEETSVFLVTMPARSAADGAGPGLKPDAH